ncbi:MAG: phage major capsid protein [Saccharothrix sp.]|nr:phage major capsid protein [Saccharothrix sp.]
MPTIHELRQERAQRAASARAILDRAQNENRDLTAEENTEFDRLMQESDDLETRINREERLREQERRVADTDPRPEPPGGPGGDRDTEAHEAAFRAYLVGGRAGLTPDQARALNMGNDPEGGYLVAPQRFVAELIQGLDDMVHLRRLANVQQLTTNESLGVPTLDTDLNDAEWTTELGTGSQDDSLRIGKRELRPQPMAKRVKVSRTLLRRAAISPETLVRQRMEYKFGVTAEKAYMTGDGNKKPLGLFIASSDGISTARDVNTGSATGFTGDGLINAKYALKSAYWQRANWLFHRQAIREIRKIKDDNGQYVWQPGLSGDRPDQILDLPYIVSEFAPNTFTSDQYVGMLGDFSYYWIADALDFEIQRLVELYAETNQVGFIGRMESDGMPVLQEAFVRLKAAV